MSRRPTLVVGAGPAGAVTALLLARAGQPVVILDRREFPRDKACGECANPGSVAQLRELGLAERVASLRPARLEGWVVRGPAGRAYRAAYPAGVRTWTVDRRRFDHLLLEAAAEAGAEVRTGVAFEAIERLDAAGGRARVRTAGRRGGESLDFHRLVGADGLHSRVRAELDLDRVGRTRKAGVSLHVRDVDLDPAWGHLGLDGDLTVGLSPLDPDGGLWTLVIVTRGGGTRGGGTGDGGARGGGTRDEAGHSAGALPAGPSEAVATAARHLPGLARATPVSELLGSGPYDRPVDRPWRPGAVLVGDAAGYLDPVTGQGMGRALGSARLAADALLAGGRPEDLATYARRVRAARRGGVRVQRLIDQVVRRPALLERLLPLLDRSGALADLVAVTGDHLPPAELAHPGRWLRWTRRALTTSRRGATTDTPPSDEGFDSPPRRA